MIYTVTLNPSLDYYVQVPDFKQGMVNRTERERICLGGKGMNVSRMLMRLGQSNVALGYVAGFTGVEIERRLAQEAREEISGAVIRPELIHLPQGHSRINIKLYEEQSGQEETEINGCGPVMGKDAFLLLLRKLEMVKSGDYLVLAGSIPMGLPDTTYQEICQSVCNRTSGVHFVIDATGKALLQTLPYRPFLIKPNIHELGALFETVIREKSEIVSYARCLQEQGALHVLVSMGSAGAMLVTAGGQVYETEAPKGIVKHAVGSGDSMVAGFLAGYLSEKQMHAESTHTESMRETNALKNAFCMGVAAGSASAFSEELASPDAVMEAARSVLRQWD